LQAACPVRPAGAIDALITAVRDEGTRGGVSVVASVPWVWVVEGGGASTWWNAPTGYPRSQDVTRKHYAEINSIQVTPRAEVLEGKRWGNPLSLLVLPSWAGVDIDDEHDYAQALIDWPAIATHLEQPARLRVEKVAID